ncbi:hypothetical protein TanjilG_16483 [Lupinus angustifolius]|uniref:Methyltransferase small domain-containing protein n=1 Tax=Lupinus angustifolius TaxID=3871 RepID=A0A1J7HKL9_LUPAN|nr:hypothetical protein TanjilG_16483 [Lupinus angustifolius]
MLLNDYLSKNVELLQGRSVIELGSGVGITGILCSGFCHKFVLTDHNDEVLKIINKNIKLHSCSEDTSPTSHGLVAEKLEWGNKDQINEILQKHPGGFDFILGADIYILIVFNSTFVILELCIRYSMDSMIITEASKHQMHLKEVLGTRTIVGNLEGVIYETTLE